MVFFNIFGITSFVLKIASSWPKLASSWLKLASSWLQVDSSWPQVDSSWPYVASSWLKLASSWLKLGPSWLQVGSGRAQNQLREAPGGSPEGSWDGLETLEKVWLTNTSEHDPRPSRQIMLRRLWRGFGSQIHLSMIRGSNDKSCSEDFGKGWLQRLGTCRPRRDARSVNNLITRPTRPIRFFAILQFCRQ